MINYWSIFPQDIFLKLIIDNNIRGIDLISFGISNSAIYRKCNSFDPKRNIFVILIYRHVPSIYKRLCKKKLNKQQIIDIRYQYNRETYVPWNFLKKRWTNELSKECIINNCINLDQHNWGLLNYSDLSVHFELIKCSCEKLSCYKHYKLCSKCDFSTCKDCATICSECKISYCYYCINETKICKICNYEKLL